VKSKLAAILAGAALLYGVFSGVANADPGNGQAVGQDPVRLLETRCGNAGAGNGAEILDDDEVVCFKRIDFNNDQEHHVKDRDPGNSGGNNAPAEPPGQAKK
jgi:hypothetical protein